ncbi:hypothetical protein RBY4I_3173 [Rhodobacterales bacterium Y4I]|nr:hypothetical protein RBY4I_3173 [Rhodobacterales bacterium Y4I]
MGPEVSLAYDSGAGASEFGLGWRLSLPAIGRQTARGLPRYRDDDTFLLHDAQDLVPELAPVSGGGDGTDWLPLPDEPRRLAGRDYLIRRYRPRVEGGFLQLERWQALGNPADCFWRSIDGVSVTRWYGRTPDSRVSDPQAPHRIYRWLINQMTDATGNIVHYSYKAEDSAWLDETPPINEAHRDPLERSAQRYLKRVRYANAQPFFPTLDPEVPEAPPETFHFELVFDYGEHDQASPTPGDAGDWALRPDAHHMGRPGFELSTYRRCQRVLMFHHFAEEDGVGADCLVRSLDLTYAAAPAGGHSLVAAARLQSYRRAGAGYDVYQGPETRFAYSEGQIATEPGTLGDVPGGLAAGTAWAMPDADALGGALSRYPGAWYNRRNLGPGPSPGDAAGRADWRGLAPVAALEALPSTATDPDSGQMLDPGNEGVQGFVELNGPAPGTFQRRAAQWQPQTAFAALPNIDPSDPHTRQIDLTGDGRADLLLSRDEELLWYPSEGRAGFGAAESAAYALEAERGPRLVFSEPLQTIFLADMTGDGLSDLVRIQNGAVSYWPNLGYGRFGGRVAMADAPHFDRPELFDPQALRLADVDGSGLADIVYLGGAGTTLWRNLSGNGWSAGQTLAAAPRRDDETQVEVLDLFGTGTACLVWSSPLPDAAGRAMRYLDLTGGVKPLLLSRVENGTGGELHLSYAPSTRFQAQDAVAGAPWITHIPFVVQCLHRLETRDLINRNLFVSRFSYHHGYYDPVEREFAGFARTEAQDLEMVGALAQEDPIEAASGAEALITSRAPVLMRHWHHTGAAFDDGSLMAALASEMWAEPDPGGGGGGGDAREPGLPETQLPPGLTTGEAREAARALRGTLLRSEVYALDGTDAADAPFSVEDMRPALRLIQPRAGNRYAVFLVEPGEQLSRVYDRVVDDPRVTHQLTLQTDRFGNPLLSASVAYGRRQTDPDLAAADAAIQQRMFVTVSQASYTAPVFQQDARRLPMACTSAAFELTGGDGPLGPLWRPDALVAAIAGAERRPVEAVPEDEAPGGGALLRVLSRTETLYRRDDLSGPLPLHEAEPLALPFESYQMAVSDAQLQDIFGDDRLGPDPDALMADEGRYVRRPDDPDSAWWIPSGRVFFAPEPAPAAAELAAARAGFFRLRRTEDPFGAATRITYDRYQLLPLQTEDALGNRVTAGDRAGDGTPVPQNDYRLMTPRQVTDANGDRVVAAFDVAGRLVATARLGQPVDDTGETLLGLDTDPDPAVLDAVLLSPEGPEAQALAGESHSRIVYDDQRFQRAGAPGRVVTLARQETGGAAIEAAVAYSDGFGMVAQTKTRAAPGPVEGGPADVEVDLRWASDGWTVLNAKGDPVRQWEPFYTASAAFEPLRETGASSILLYDAPGRLRGTLYPDKRWKVIEIGPWRGVSHAPNDTVLDAATADPIIGPEVLLLPEGTHSPSWHDLRTAPAHAPAFAQRYPDAQDRAEETAAAQKAAALARTPTATFLDAKGDVFLSRAGDGAGTTLEVRTRTDISGHTLSMTDPRGLVISRALVHGGATRGHDAAGRALFGSLADEGETRALPAIDGQPMRSWTARGDRLRAVYDILRRPTETHLTEQAAGGPERLVERRHYGESHPDPAARLRQRLHLHYDGAGEVQTTGYDFQGNILGSARRLRRDSRGTLDWSALAGAASAAALQATAAAQLEAESLNTATLFDRLGRARQRIDPDGSLTRMGYDIAGALVRLEVQPRGTGPVRAILDGVTYNARGQRAAARYAIAGSAAVEVTHIYDPETWRLGRHRSTRSADGRVLQNVAYAYDADGHITSVRDDAQQAVFFANAVVEPRCDYTYDPFGRLIQASGREHTPSNIVQRDAAPGEPLIGVPFANDAAALQTYTQRYAYDLSGNIISMRHQSGANPSAGWQRCYQHALDSNRLLATGAPGEVGAGTACPAPHVAAPTLSGRYAYDAAGCMGAMPHLPLMQWDYRNRLITSARQVVADGLPETTHYVYDGAGTRLRKITLRATESTNAAPRARQERISLGGWERYREFAADGETVLLERLTLHAADETGRVALIETLTVENGVPVAATAPEMRFHFGNHLGSAVLELDESAAVIAYEEFHPFGSTAYLGGRSAREVAARRFRYIGRERDEETGLGHHGLRYYAPWLGRWTSPDPIGTGDGLNVYRYAGNDPVGASDASGLMKEGFDAEEARKRLQEIDSLLKEDETLKQELRADLAELQKRSEKLDADIKQVKAEVHEQEAINRNRMFILRHNERIREGKRNTARRVRAKIQDSRSRPIDLVDLTPVAGPIRGVAENTSRALAAADIGDTEIVLQEVGLGVVNAGFAILDALSWGEATAARNAAKGTYIIARTEAGGIARKEVTAAVNVPSSGTVAAPLPGEAFGRVQTHSDLPSGTEPYQLELLPPEPYHNNRERLYGKNPSSADKEAVGFPEGRWFDHEPELGLHWYQGTGPNPEIGQTPLPGYNQTRAERLERGGTFKHGKPASPESQQSQGHWMKGVMEMYREKVWNNFW